MSRSRPPSVRLGVALLRALWVLGVAGFVVLLVVARSREIDPVAHDRYARAIRDAAALDSQLDAEVMQSRQSLVNHYDDIVHTITSLEMLHKRLREVPKFLGDQERKEIHERVSASSQVLATKEGMIETFKSENAVLRNSVHFFPVDAMELRDRLLAVEQGPAIAKAVNELLCNVLRFNTQPSDTLRERAAKNLETLMHEVAPPGFEEDVDIVRLHARTVLERRDRVDGLTNEIVAVPARARLEALDATYARTFQSALRATEQRRLALFVLALFVLLCVSADFIFYLAKVARESGETSKQLAAANEQLATANAALERDKEHERELVALKNGFISMTSHEFRTPLTVILGSTELLEAYGDRWPSAKKADHWAKIKTSVENMRDLMDQILFIGRADAGKLPFAPVRLNLARRCQEIVDATSPTLGAMHTLQWELRGDLEEAWVDEKLLSHILTNLLSNAIKYSPDGGIVRFEVWRDGDQARMIVSDQGIGIDGSDLARLYDSFHRGANVGEIRGTGLGLAVVKRAIDAHGGELQVTTEKGVGTAFYVRLPITEPLCATGSEPGSRPLEETLSDEDASGSDAA